MNGFELQSELAAAGYAIPIIFVTAYDDKESRGRAMQAGAVAFLSKPFSDEQLIQTVRSALGHDNGGTKTIRLWRHTDERIKFFSCNTPRFAAQRKACPKRNVETSVS